MKSKRGAFAAGCFSGLILGAILVVVGTIGGMLLFKDTLLRMASSQLRVPPITAGLMADYDWQATGPGGEVLDMAETKGKTVFLNIWHPDCPNCLTEVPAINNLFLALQGEDVLVVSVAPCTVEELGAAVAEEGILYPAYAVQKELPEVYRSTSAPLTFIVAPSGKIVFKHLGSAKWDDETCIAFLRSLAREDAPAPE